jgi:hypothetical protein
MPFRHYSPAEHDARVAALLEMRAAVHRLPPTATRHDIERTMRGVFNRAEALQCGDRVRRRLNPTTWQRVCRFFRRK